MRTKIIATLGPASNNYETMKAMVAHGVRIFRLNFSHADAAYFAPTVKRIRELENEFGFPLTALGDLCGPKTRIGEIKGSPVQIEKGNFVSLALPDLAGTVGDNLFIPLDFPELLKGLTVDMPVSLSDGMLRFKVTRIIKPDQAYEMEAQNAGLLTSNKGIAFPGKHHPIPALTEKDKKDLHEGLDIGLDAVAISFVQTRKDIEDTRAEIARHGVWVPIVAKIERQNAVDDIEGILAVADAAMIARGDLGLECPMARVPIIQKRLIRACRHAQKAAIVATQMLLSMVKNPVPTRAEATDVANAMLDGADCVMLSEETAVGSYPVEAVKFIEETAADAEAYFLERVQGPYAPKKEEHNPVKYLSYAACLLADNMEAKAIACHSTSGATARLLSSRRPGNPIYALTPDTRVQRALNFFWNVNPRPTDESLPEHIDRLETWAAKNPDLEAGDTVIMTSGEKVPGCQEIHTNQVKIYYKTSCSGYED
jgi:pyruvate kinase